MPVCVCVCDSLHMCYTHKYNTCVDYHRHTHTQALNMHPVVNVYEYTVDTPALPPFIITHGPFYSFFAGHGPVKCVCVSVCVCVCVCVFVYLCVCEVEC